MMMSPIGAQGNCFVCALLAPENLGALELDPATGRGV